MFTWELRGRIALLAQPLRRTFGGMTTTPSRRDWLNFVPAFVCAIIVIAASSCELAAQPTNTATSFIAGSRYETRAEHDPSGIGKFYLGREIAHVMRHEGADPLRPDFRALFARPHYAPLKMNHTLHT